MKPLILAIVLCVALASVIVLSDRDLPRTDHEVVHLADDALAFAH